MPTPLPRRSRSSPPRRFMGWRWLTGLAMLLTVGTVGGAWWLYRESGRSPGELFDYVEQRLEGHTLLQALATEPLALLRSALGVSRASDRLNLPFPVPPPPARRGPADVPSAEPTPPGVKVWRVGKGGSLLRIADAARLAGDGDIVEIEAGDYRGDVAVWEQSRLTIRGVNGAARLFADGQSAEGKAIWVLRKGDFSIANIDFIGARLGDGNGAGIRFEAGRLRVRNCLFWDNQMGLLTGGEAPVAASAVLHVENSEFAYSHVDGRWGHNIYVGAIAEFSITGSYSHHAGRGHLLKSRARSNQVLYNRFTDESGGRASYELDFPNGGLVRVVGNVVQQQPDTDNSTLIAYGEEGYATTENRLWVASNTLINDLRYGGTYIHAAQGATSVVSANNLLVGPGVQRGGSSFTEWNDVRADWEDLERPARQDWRPHRAAPGLAYRALSDTDELRQLEPRAVYVHPRSVVPLVAPPTVVGALPPAAP